MRDRIPGAFLRFLLALGMSLLMVGQAAAIPLSTSTPHGIPAWGVPNADHDGDDDEDNGRLLNVMTRNMFIGTDFGPILTATTFDQFASEVAIAYLHVQQSNIPERAAALAKEIRAKQPDLVGLQEASIWRTGPLFGAATTVTYDALQSLLDELAARTALHPDRRSERV